MTKNPYEVLGVDRNASDSDIRKAFLKLSKKYHPDMQAGKTDAEKRDAEERFKEVNEANEILSDKDKRRNYDTFGSAEGQPDFGGGGVDPREFFRHMRHGFGDVADFDDFEYSMGGGKGRPRRDPNGPKDGRDARCALNISFEDAIFGVEKEFSFTMQDPCPDCNGTGAEGGKTAECPDCHGTGMVGMRRGMMFIQQTCGRCGGTGFIVDKKCQSCGGSGRVASSRKMSLLIPMGVKSGVRLRVAGEGEKGVNGGKNGDIYLTINVAPSGMFERNGDDLITVAHIPQPDAILGGVVDVQTPWGVATVNVPRGVGNGTIFKLHNQGVRDDRGNGGDLYVRIEVDTLENMTDAQEKLIKKLKKTITDSNFPNVTRQKKTNADFEKRVVSIRPKPNH